MKVGLVMLTCPACGQDVEVRIDVARELRDVAGGRVAVVLRPYLLHVCPRDPDDGERLSA